MAYDFKGVVTALVTPFKEGNVDFDSFQKLVRFQLDNGIEGFVVNGTTGESPTLKIEEVKELFDIAKSECAGKVPIVLGTGSNSTEKTIETTTQAADWGADAALVVTPYYNKPPQRALLKHFRVVADASDIPVILYNVPGRTVISISDEVVAELSKHKNIIGIKEASGEAQNVVELKKSVVGDFIFTSGDDNSCLDFISLGGEGVISVVSHIIPKQAVEMSNAIRDGKEINADEKSFFLKACDIVGMDTNPIPAKMALYLMGIISSPELRLPLVELEKDKMAEMEKELKQLGII